MSSSAWPSWPSVSYYSTSNAATPSFVHTTTTAHTRPCIHSATSTASIIINTTISSVVVLIRDVFASSQIFPPIPDPKHPSTNHNQGPHTRARSIVSCDAPSIARVVQRPHPSTNHNQGPHIHDRSIDRVMRCPIDRACRSTPTSIDHHHRSIRDRPRSICDRSRHP